jgi:hypothetical protein
VLRCPTAAREAEVDADGRRTIGGYAPEKDVVKSVKTFKDYVQQWRDKGHDTLLTTAAKSALFVSSVGVLALLNADSPTAIAVAGAIIGGKAIKTIKKIGKRCWANQLAREPISPVCAATGENSVIASAHHEPVRRA